MNNDKCLIQYTWIIYIFGELFVNLRQNVPNKTSDIGVYHTNVLYMQFTTLQMPLWSSTTRIRWSWMYKSCDVALSPYKIENLNADLSYICIGLPNPTRWKILNPGKLLVQPFFQNCCRLPF